MLCSINYLSFILFFLFFTTTSVFANEKNEEIEGKVTVKEGFVVEIIDYEENIKTGDDIAVLFEVVNIGPLQTQNITLNIRDKDKEEIHNYRDDDGTYGITLDSGEAYVGNFSWIGENPGRYEIVLSTEDDYEKVYTTFFEDIEKSPGTYKYDDSVVKTAIASNVSHIASVLNPGETQSGSIKFWNLGTEEVTLNLSVEELDEWFFLKNREYYIATKDTVSVPFDIEVPEKANKGMYKGSIHIKIRNTTWSYIPVVLKIKEILREDIFDVTVEMTPKVFSENDTVVYRGIIESSENFTVNTSIRTSISDYRDHIVFNRTETISINETYKKHFEVYEKLEPGDYTLNFTIEPEDDIYLGSSDSVEFTVIPYHEKTRSLWYLPLLALALSLALFLTYGKIDKPEIISK